MKVQVYSSKHAENRLSQRYGTVRFKDVLPSEDVKLYRDKFDRTKFYFNLDGGFIVLMKVGYNKYLVKTVTTQGKIDDRSFIVLKKVEVVEAKRR